MRERAKNEREYKRESWRECHRDGLANFQGRQRRELKLGSRKRVGFASCEHGEQPAAGVEIVANRGTEERFPVEKRKRSGSRSLKDFLSSLKVH